MNLERLQKEQFRKSLETTDDLVGNKIPDKITRVSKLHQRIIQYK